MFKKIIIGFIAGIISGFFASGGGLILVPAFVYFFKLNEKESRATSIFAVLPMVIISGILYNSNTDFDWIMGIKCAIGGIIGGFIGAKLLNKTSPITLKILFIIFLLYTAIRMIIK